MIKFKIDDVEYKLPEFISIENYAKIYKVKDLFSDTYFAAKIISLITNAPLEKVLEQDYEKIEYMSAYVLSLIPIDKPQFVDRFEIDGINYGFFPDWKELTFAEFVDMDTISTKKPEELLDLLHILSAVMYRPIIEETSKHDYKIEKYNVESMKKRAEIFKTKLDITYVLGAQFFFINYATKFLNYTHLSSIQKISIWTKIKMIWLMRRWIWAAITSKKSLDGSLSSTELVKTILQSIK